MIHIFISWPRSQINLNSTILALHYLALLILNEEHHVVLFPCLKKKLTKWIRHVLGLIFGQSYPQWTYEINDLKNQSHWHVIWPKQMGTIRYSWLNNHMIFFIKQCAEQPLKCSSLKTKYGQPYPYTSQAFFEDNGSLKQDASSSFIFY